MRKRSGRKKRENSFLYHIRAAINCAHMDRINFTEDIRSEKVRISTAES